MLEPSRISSPGNIEDRRLRRLYEYWEEKRDSGHIPARGDIDPAEIPDLLGHVNLFEVRDDPRDYRVRLNGTEVTRILGREVTGRWCSEVITGDDGERCKRAFDICVDEWSPVIVETSLAFCCKPYTGQTIVALPLSADGRRVDTIITVHVFHALDVRAEVLPFGQASEG